MAYLLRSLAVIGVIALQSPVHGGKPAAPEAAETLVRIAKAAGSLDPHSAAQSITAAREAAQILSELDPQTRQRVLQLATTALSGSAAGAPERSQPRTR